MISETILLFCCLVLFITEILLVWSYSKRIKILNRAIEGKTHRINNLIEINAMLERKHKKVVELVKKELNYK